ncbi:ABC transporter substrate-binding protein [uncultured Dialister sp.]|uniref:ABC transporter substrate-binding protein n=1 Tax=uncultured Dialister sp. TaxID=278064 RepID=UPI00260F59D5|nr:ABC transporter substrate-binding protein [uncultured Dialister sp.]
MKNWKKLALLAACCSLALTLSACGTKTGPASSAASKAAAGDKKITVYMPSPAGLSSKLAKDYEKKTGTKVEIFQGTTGEILARLEAEKNNQTADVVVLASWSDGLSLKKKGVLVPYKPKDADKMVMDFMDKDNELTGYSASAVGVIYNKNVIPSLSADWSELSDPAYKDNLAIPDPQKSGACKDFLAGYVNAKGWDALEGMAKNGMIVPGANKAALEAVTTGEKGILVAGVDYNAYTAMKKGEPLAIYYPKSGTIVNPRPAMIMKNAPHEEEAKKFMDYLISDDAQKLVADAYLIPGRQDIEAKGTPLSKIPQIHPDWEKMMAIASDTAAKLNELCRK